MKRAIERLLKHKQQRRERSYMKKQELKEQERHDAEAAKDDQSDSLQSYYGENLVTGRRSVDE